MSWWKWAGKPKPAIEEHYVITSKDVVHSILTPSEFFNANHDEIHLGHITWHAMVQLQVGLMDQMAGMIENNK